MAFSPTDARLLAVGYDGEADHSHVSLWDIDAGTEPVRLPGANDLPEFNTWAGSRTVGALGFSPDGKYLVAGFGSKDFSWEGASPNPLKVWEVATRRLIHRLNGHSGLCQSLEFSRDGKLLASGSQDGTAILWSIETWKAIHTLQNPDRTPNPYTSPAGRSFVGDVAFSPEGKTLAMASLGGNVHLWDVATGKLVDTLTGHSNQVRALAFAPDGRTLASGSTDLTVRLWNVETRRQLMQLDSASVALGRVMTLAFSPDGKQLLAGGDLTAFWSAAPIVWDDPGRAAEKLRLLIDSNADFQSRIRMLSENLRLHEALSKLDSKERRVQAALAAAEANWRASRKAWPEAVAVFDRLLAAAPKEPEGWLRTPGLLSLATALLHQNRPSAAAMLLQGGANRRIQDGLPAIARSDAATGELLSALEERLAETPHDAGLLELRAELAGQWSDAQAQVADYTAAIQILAKQRPEAESAHLRRLRRRRGDAFVNLKKWSEAVADYTQVITPETTDAVLLSNRARAHEALSKWDAAAADWSRAAGASPQGIKWLTEFARRLDIAGQAPLADAARAKGRGWLEEKLAKEPENPALAEELAQLLLEHDNQHAGRWAILKPLEVKSELGATLSVLPDQSVLASGPNPLNDLYRVRTTLERPTVLAAIRVEALTHESLPRNGPGRHTWGSFAQNSLKVTAVRPGKDGPLALEFHKAWSDRQLEWPVSKKGEWNIGGATLDARSGRNHTAVWFVPTPLFLAAGTTLTFEMEFNSWENTSENIGRFRLSVSSNSAVTDFEQKRAVAIMVTDPWARLAAACAALRSQRQGIGAPYHSTQMGRQLRGQEADL